MNSIDPKWIDSEYYSNAVGFYRQRLGRAADMEQFPYSPEFRNARHAFRKTVNGSWGKEAC